MAKYTKQDRKDMSIGMRNYDKGYAKGRNERYMKGGMGKEMGHASTVRPIETSEAEKFDLGKVQWRPDERRGYDMQAFDYPY